jgi:nucleoside-diphosphate-sugar epimerase
MQHNILLTGASGFIGYHVAMQLHKAGFRIFAPVRPLSYNEKKISGLEKIGISIFRGNFYNQEILKKIFENDIFCIVHMAAVRGMIKNQEDIYRTVNIDGTKVLLEFAKKNNTARFLYCSTVGVMGTIPKIQPANKNNQEYPDNTYHLSKWEAEKVVKNFHSETLRTLILRPTITYGAGDDGFMLRLVSMVMKTRFINCLSTVRIHMLNAESFAALITKIISEDKFDGQNYIVADKESVRLKDLVNLIYSTKNESQYPVYLTVPSIVFKAAASLLQALGQAGLSTSIKLISQSWVYDITETKKYLNYKPVDTFQRMEPMIKDYINALQN